MSHGTEVKDANTGMKSRRMDAKTLQPTNRSRIAEVFLPPWNPKVTEGVFLCADRSAKGCWTLADRFFRRETSGQPLEVVADVARLRATP